MTNVFITSFRYIGIFLFILIFEKVAAKNPSAELDSLLLLATKAMEVQDFEQSVSLGQKALNISLIRNDHDATILCYYRIAHGLAGLEMFKECLNIIDRVERDYRSALVKNVKLKSDFTNLLARNYLVLGFNNRAVTTILKELQIAKAIPTEVEKKEVEVRCYMMLAACYQASDKDSVYYYLTKIAPILSKGRQSEQSLFYYNLAYYHINHTMNLDSSFYYNNKGLSLDSINNLKYISFGLLQKADILFKQQQYSSSLNICLQALLVVNKQKRIDYVLELYSLIASNYKMLGDRLKQAEYLSQLTHVRDSVTNIRKKTIETASNILINAETEVFRKEKQRTFILSSIIIFAISGILIAVLVKLKGIKSRKKRLLVLKEIEVRALESRLHNNSYEEVLSLAKSNSADFLCRFQEIYPAFMAKLLEIDPSLQTTELRFCAYLKLNFATKEIATYTFVTPKAVQNRKNRIRKKLDIPSEEDINVWIGKLG